MGETDADMAAFGASDAACYKWPDDTPEHRALRAAYMEGAADAVRRDHADDGDAVTEEWLRSVGFTRHMQPAAGNDLSYRLLVGLYLYWSRGRVWLGNTPWAGQRTRGDVRRLCSALGRPLNEPKETRP